MGVQKLMLLSLLLFSFCSPASFSSICKNLVSENSHENMGGNGIDEMNTRAIRGGGGGGGGGGQSGGDGGQSNSSPQGGGNGAVPVYAAGAAAGQRRNHKGGAANCTQCWKGGFAVLITITLASLLLHIPM